MTDEWKPTKELIDWAKGHFSQMSIGGVWMPEGSGLTYVKVDEKKWRLKSMIDTDESKANHDRMKMLMWDVGIVIIDDEPSMLPVPTSAEEAYMQEVHMKREIAQSWADKDGTLLVEMGLEEVYPEYIEDKEILLENGDVQNVEIWAFRPTNPNTGETGMWTWDPQAGWRDDTQWTGPRTTYEDGTTIPSFGDVRDGVFDDSDDDLPIQPLPMCDDPSAINYGESGICKFPPAAPTPSPDAPTNGTTTGAPPFVNIGSPVGGAFTGMAPQGLSYSATSLPSTAPAPSVKNIDYVKLLRGWLTNSLFKDLI